MLFVARRLLITIPVLLTLSVFVFLLIHLVPGDPVQTMLGFRATPENVAVTTGGAAPAGFRSAPASASPVPASASHSRRSGARRFSCSAPTAALPQDW